MIDDDDVGDVAMYGVLSGTPWWLLIPVVIALAVCASNNKDECSKMHCPNGQTPTLQHHACQCVTEAKP